ncbi:MAG: carboxymuconolactone decarboxylase family protein [Candidatus Heteroscillospira sp.]|jgi:4-carboxymuconolactone decarboxylase
MNRAEISEFDPEFMEIANRFLNKDVMSRSGLTDVQKSLVIITALTATQTWKALPQYTKSALAMGASPEEIKETLYQCAPYIGIEKVRCALDEVNPAFQAAGIDFPLPKQGTVTEDTRFEKGLAVQQKIFGEENISNMRAAAPAELKHIQDYLSDYCFGDFYTRGALDLRMRELITFCAICSLGGCEPQAKAHAGANLNVGNTREMLIDAITLCLPFIGFPRTLNAIACISQVC